MKLNTKADRSVIVFKEIFSRFGLPYLLVCDNGPQYRSDNFKIYVG